MTDKERLDEIKNEWATANVNGFQTKHIGWLIDQVEQAVNSTDTILSLGKKIDALQVENMKYREAILNIERFVKSSIFESESEKWKSEC